MIVTVRPLDADEVRAVRIAAQGYRRGSVTKRRSADALNGPSLAPLSS